MRGYGNTIGLPWEYHWFTMEIPWNTMEILGYATERPLDYIGIHWNTTAFLRSASEYHMGHSEEYNWITTAILGDTGKYHLNTQECTSMPLGWVPGGCPSRTQGT
jgi:hypothetical protein